MSDEQLPDDPFEETTGEQAAEANPTTGTTGGLDPVGKLLDGSAPGPSVQEIQGDYGLAREWSIALRGMLRTTTGDGIPPLFEILMGSALGFVKLQRGGGTTTESSSNESEGSPPELQEEMPEP